MTLEYLQNLKEDDGATLKNGKFVSYKSGWQVATEGYETRDAAAALGYIEKLGGNCGIWFSQGVYYIDRSRRVDTKREAMEIGRAHNQISILGWRNMKLAYC